MGKKKKKPLGAVIYIYIYDSICPGYFFNYFPFPFPGPFFFFFFHIHSFPFRPSRRISRVLFVCLFVYNLYIYTTNLVQSYPRVGYIVPVLEMVAGGGIYSKQRSSGSP